MKTSTLVRFVLAVVFATLACIAMFMQLGAVGLLSGVAWLLLTGFSELIRPIPPRELWPTFVVGGVFLAVALTSPFLHLHTTTQNAVVRAIASLAFWLFWMWAIHRRWQKEKGADA
jgi:prepilin signal peptidase PulO-like enzyme (type II secretory pathway)